MQTPLSSYRRPVTAAVATFALTLALFLGGRGVAAETQVSQPVVPADWNAKQAGDEVMARLVKTSSDRVKGAHDAEFVCVGEKAYIVSEANDEKSGESAGWPYIYATLSIVDLKSLKLERDLEFARTGQKFANETLPAGACFVPRIIQKDDKTLRCYFASEEPGRRQSQMWYRDFDLPSQQFAPTIHRVKLKTVAGTFDMQPQYFHADAKAQGFQRPSVEHGLFIFSAFKQYDGHTYVALNNFPGKQNALAVLHDDFTTFDVVGHFNEPQSEQLSESALERLPDGSWLAVCRNDKGNYHFTTSKDGRAWTVGRPLPSVPNGLNSKPTLDKFGDLYYLGWQEASDIDGVRRSVFNLDVSRDGKAWQRKYRFESKQSFQYPAFHEHNGVIWLSVTQGDTPPTWKDRIMFGKLEDVDRSDVPADRNAEATPTSRSGFAEIQVVDEATGQGVPLVELETVNSLRFVTDNAGRVAFCEPGLLNREVFFTVTSHGYEAHADGFGFRGARVTPAVGKPAVVKLKRVNIAERLCRLTGEGLYRDTLLLGHKPALAASPHPGLVAGQDSIQAVIYRDKVYCFWGDTQQMKYPLGLYRMAGATLDLSYVNDPDTDPRPGLAYDYFVDRKTGFARAMMPLNERPEGVVWVEAVFTVPDHSGVEKLVGHYSRRNGLADELEQGIAVYNDDSSIFESVVQLPLKETWRKPQGPPIKHTFEGRPYLLFGSPSPNVRVPATLEAVLDADQYEALTCALPAESAGRPKPDLATDGKPRRRWQRELPPTTGELEHHWLKTGQLRQADATYCPTSADDDQTPILLHRGTVRWNAHRKRWVLVANQHYGKSSLLGEVWYSEAQEPTGPFRKAVKIVTHDKQTFYNICHHEFLDRDGGRTIHFEGTYTNDFSGNPHKTPRYNYNQILYRLDLDDPRLATARAE